MLIPNIKNFTAKIYNRFRGNTPQQANTAPQQANTAPQKDLRIMSNYILTREVSEAWKNLVEAVTSESSEIYEYTMLLKQELTNFKAICKSKEINFADAISTLSPTLDIIKWMHHSYVPRYCSTMVNTGTYIRGIEFYGLIPTFELVSGIALHKNKEILKKLLMLDVSNILGFISTRDKHYTMLEVDSTMVRLTWILNCISDISDHIDITDMSNVKDIFHINKITEISLWQISYNSESVKELVKILNTLKLIPPCDALEKLNKQLYQFNSLNHEQVFYRLANAPASLISSSYGLEMGNSHDGISGEAFFNQAKYPHLSECHCCKSFSRKNGNFRDLSEEHLIKIVQAHESDNIRLAIFGSGNLLQVAIIIAKIYTHKPMLNIKLDLVDPESFRKGFNIVANDFINLLLDWGFSLTLSSTASKICGSNNLNSTNPDFKGNITMDFCRNAIEDESIYSGPADVIFINDCSIPDNVLKRNLEAAANGAYVISAELQLGIAGKKEVKFSTKRKQGLPNEWETLFAKSESPPAPRNLKKFIFNKS